MLTVRLTETTSLACALDYDASMCVMTLTSVVFLWNQTVMQHPVNKFHVAVAT